MHTRNAARTLLSLLPCLLVGLGLLVCSETALAADGPIRLELPGGDNKELAPVLKMLGVLTVIALIPMLLVSVTSFLRIVVVLAFLRNALGVNNIPPSQVMLGLALFLTASIMAPTGMSLYEKAVEPYVDGKVPFVVAYHRGVTPLREFMAEHVREADLALFYDIASEPAPETLADVPMRLMVPAFILSELRTAFEMGFMLFLPFILLDLIVASILMAMGMVMLPPALVSLPIKVMLFVLTDGWNLIVESLVRSFT